MNSKPVIGKLNRTNLEKQSPAQLVEQGYICTSDSLEILRDLTDSEVSSEPPLKINTRIVSKKLRTKKVVVQLRPDQLT